MAMYKSNLGKLSEQLGNQGAAFGEYNELEKKILELSDLQLDGKMHWMVMTEPDFQRYYLENVKYHLHSSHPAGSISDKNIFSCIEMSANSIEKDFSETFSLKDLAMIQSAFNMFSLNDFENGDCSLWSIKPSLNPDYPYDWILWKDDYPVVQYSSETRQIDPCLDYYDFSLDKFNSVVEAISQASENGVVPGIMCASELKNVHAKDSFYMAKDALRKAGLKVDDVQRNGNLMSVKLVARDPDNEYFRYLAMRVNFNYGDGKDLIREAEATGYLIDGDSFCRQQIHMNGELLDYPLNDLLREAENIVAVFKNAVSDAKEKFINDMPLEVSLDGFRTALDRFSDSGFNKGTCGSWDIQNGKNGVVMEISYDGCHVVDCFSHGEVYGLKEGIGVLTRKSGISDNVFSEICDMVHTVFPEYVMAPFERDKINANNQSQGIK